MPNRLITFLLLALIATALCRPLADVLSYPGRISVLPNLQTDAEAYHNIATAIASTWSLEALPPRHPPGWVTLLALVYCAVGVSYVAGKLVSWAALILSVCFCAWLARQMYGRRAGWVAALLAASSPALRWYVGTLQYEVFTGTLLLLVLAAAVHASAAVERSTLLRRAALVGLLGASLVITRESFALVVPLIGAWLAHRLRSRMSGADAVRVAMLVTVVAAAPPTAWSAIQSVRTGTLITISEKGPIVVELGNNPRANGTYNAPLVGIGQPTGLRFVMSAPSQWLWLAGRKVLYFWGVLRDGWNVPRPAATWLWRATTGIVPLEVFGAAARGGWLLALFIAALWMLGRDGLARWWGLPAAVIGVMTVHIATLSSHRFAVPVLPVVFVVVSQPVTRILEHVALLLRSRAIQIAAAVLLGVVVTSQFRTWPLSVDHEAAALDGLTADNVVDPRSHSLVRHADAGRGVRPVVLLTDEYLPNGHLFLDVGFRLAGPAPLPDTPVTRVSLVELDGRIACSRDVTARELKADTFERVRVSCTLPSDTIATFAVFSLGTADFAVNNVKFSWAGGP